MQINIHPDATFSTGNVEKMLNIEGLNSQRIKMLCQRGLVPAVKAGGKQSHYNIKFKDFDKVITAHQQVRTVSKGQKIPTMEQFNVVSAAVEVLNDELARAEERYAQQQETIKDLIDRIQFLEQLYEISPEAAETTS